MIGYWVYWILGIGYWVLDNWRFEMAMVFEDLKVLQSAERVADSIWKQVSRWDKFARDVVGKQMARAADSVGANIA